MNKIIEELQNLPNDEIENFFDNLFSKMTRNQLKEISDSLNKKSEDLDAGYDVGYEEGYDAGYEKAKGRFL